MHQIGHWLLTISIVFHNAKVSWKHEQVEKDWVTWNLLQTQQKDWDLLVEFYHERGQPRTNTAKLILLQYNCWKITVIFWCMVWGAQWIFKWTYLHLLLSTRSFSSWCKLMLCRLAKRRKEQTSWRQISWRRRHRRRRGRRCLFMPILYSANLEQRTRKCIRWRKNFQIWNEIVSFTFLKIIPRYNSRIYLGYKNSFY